MLSSRPVFQTEDDHHFRKPANDITAQLEINFGDLGRPSRGRGGPRGGRGSRGRGEGRGEFRGEFREPREPRERDSGAPTRPTRGGRTDKVKNTNYYWSVTAAVERICHFTVYV